MIGTTISHYKVAAELGRGGMGVVYQALDTKLDRMVALKFLSTSTLPTDHDKARFFREARAAAKLNHAHIAHVYEIDEVEDGQAFIAMEYVEGETLSEKILRGPLKLQEALVIACQVAEALQAAHEQGIVHRDVKSSNVMLNTRGQVKVMDFGLARMAGATLLTREGTTVGTIAYMSPEQARGEEVDERSDLWSVGIVLYEMISGCLPFARDYEQAVVYGILNENPEPLTGLRTGVPMELERVVMKCLAKDAGHRYQHVDELLVDLQAVRRVLEAGNPKADPMTARSTRRHVALYGGGAVLVCALLALGVFLVRHAGNPEDLPSPSAPSIAVLPLNNYSGDPSQDFFADGMTGELITTLTKIEGLSPISHRSVIRFKGSEETIPEIARLMGIDYIVDGSVLQAEGKVRLTISLFDGNTDKPIWGERYEREHVDVLAMQQELAQAIAQAIEVALTPQDARRLAETREVDPEAHRLYLESQGDVGSQNWNIERLKRAIEIDPDYALAYGALAEAYVLSNIRGLLSSEEAIPKAKEAAESALALDPRIAEAHTALGEVSAHYEWDWDAAVDHFERALASNPGYAIAHWRHAGHLAALGRSGEAIAVGKRAQELDPPGYWGMASLYYHTRRYDKAINLIREHLVVPGDSRWRDRLGQAYIHAGLDQEGISELEQVGEEPGTERLLLAWGYANVGRTSEAREILNEASDQQVYVSPYYVAMVHAALGEADQALEVLEQAYEIRDANLIWVNVEQAFDPLHSAPRFQSLLKKIGFNS